jgi:hypothetical protein
MGERLQFNFDVRDTKIFEQIEQLKEVFGDLPRRVLVQKCFSIVIQLSKHAEDGRVTLVSGDKEVVFFME